MLLNVIIRICLVNILIPEAQPRAPIIYFVFQKFVVRRNDTAEQEEKEVNRSRLRCTNRDISCKKYAMQRQNRATNHQKKPSFR